jgi:transposase
MFVRAKKSGTRRYLQVVENRWEDGAVRQRVIATLGRLDQLQAQGHIDSIVRSLGRFAEEVRVVQRAANGRLEARSVRRIGPARVFQRLWEHTGIAPVLEELLRERRFEFAVERAVFLSVLHRRFSPGSDRQADRWRDDYEIPGVQDLQLHHLYRAMRWLGSVREQVEQRLFARRRDLFTAADLVFFDTTSIYFEGAGGESLGQYGHSKDHRPDRLQMIVGAVVDSTGKPICAPMWPGNRADVTTLLPVAEDLRTRFGIARVSLVADRGMIRAKTIQALEAQHPPMGYILGARLRNTKEVRDEVLGRGGRYKTVAGNLQVKEVRVDDRRYVVCLNPQEAERDAAARAAMVEALEHKLQQGASELVANRGYKRFLRVDRGAMTLDRAKIRQDARYDGKFVLRTNLDLPSDEVALRYKELWQVERIFRDAKSLLETRPVFHHWDATICGHVFVSFLALVLLRELQARQEARGLHAEWLDVRRDLDALEEVEVLDNGHTYWLRAPVKPGATAAFRAAGVGIPPTVREG